MLTQLRTDAKRLVAVLLASVLTVGVVVGVLVAWNLMRELTRAREPRPAPKDSFAAALLASSVSRKRDSQARLSGRRVIA